MSEPSQEPLNERAAVVLTRSEKDALRLVSLFDEVSESSLLRDSTVAQIVERATALRRQADPVEAA